MALSISYTGTDIYCSCACLCDSRYNIVSKACDIPVWLETSLLISCCPSKDVVSAAADKSVIITIVHKLLLT
uniref:Uncharacterized protein n=1 Tax=Arion vulgaris TaxID=1028688 RepID=A0A0B6Y692_9EUPU